MSALLDSTSATTPYSSSSSSTFSLHAIGAAARSHPAHYAAPSSLPVSLSLASSVDPLSSPSSPSSSTTSSASPSAAAIAEEGSTSKSDLQPKYSFSTSHFALGDLPLFAKAKIRLGELFLTSQQQTPGRHHLGSISLQLRRSPKTVEEIEEERYWQEGEGEEEEDW